MDIILTSITVICAIICILTFPRRKRLEKDTDEEAPIALVVYYIPVGNIPPREVPQYIEMISKSCKPIPRTQSIFLPRRPGSDCDYGPKLEIYNFADIGPVTDDTTIKKLLAIPPIEANQKYSNN